MLTLETNRVNIDSVSQNCIIYTRVSSDEQITNFSLQTQEDFCKREAERRNLKTLKTFKEEGVSAKTLNRPELISLFDFARKNKNNINFVLIYRFDRLSRQTSDFLACRKTFADMGIKIISATEPVGDSVTDEFFETLLAALAQLDNAIRAERAKNGLKARFLSGLPTGRPPLGYINSKVNDKQVIIPDPLSFKKMQQCWELMATGTKTLRSIAGYMNDNGLYLNLSNKKFSIRSQTASRLFRNKFYMGVVTSNIYPEEIQGKHTPMISEAMFYQVQAILDGRKTNLNIKRIRQDETFSLRGSIYCECGSKLTGAWCKGRNKKYPLLWCPDPKHKTRSVSVDKLETQLVEYLRKITPTPETKELFLAKLKEKYYKRLKGLKSRIANSQKEIEELKATRTLLAEKNLKGTYSDDVYKEMDQKLKDQLLGANIVKNEDLIDRYDIEAIISFASELLSDLGKAFMLGGQEQRILLLGSIFEKKLQLYKTGTLNRQIGRISPLFQAIQNPQKFASRWVGAQGLEP